MKNRFLKSTFSIIAGLALIGCASLNPNTEGQLKSAIEAKSEAFQACYEKALERDRETKGTMGLKLDINASSGQVTDSSIEQSSIADEAMKSCVAGAVRDITLPEPPGVAVEGHYDIAFNFAP